MKKQAYSVHGHGVVAAYSAVAVPGFAVGASVAGFMGSVLKFNAGFNCAGFTCGAGGTGALSAGAAGVSSVTCAPIWMGAIGAPSAAGAGETFLKLTGEIYCFQARIPSIAFIFAWCPISGSLNPKR